MFSVSPALKYSNRFFIFFFFPLSDHNHLVDYFCRLWTCWVCLCCHNPPNADMNHRIFIVGTLWLSRPTAYCLWHETIVKAWRSQNQHGILWVLCKASLYFNPRQFFCDTYKYYFQPLEVNFIMKVLFWVYFQRIFFLGTTKGCGLKHFLQKA